MQEFGYTGDGRTKKPTEGSGPAWKQAMPSLTHCPMSYLRQAGEMYSTFSPRHPLTIPPDCIWYNTII